MNRRWLCSDVWMDILPSFDRPQLGLKMALISDRFDILVDAHFDGKTELTIWRTIEIRKGIGMPRLFVEDKSEGFPLPNRPLPIKIRFRHFDIYYIDHFVISFLHSNQQIFNRATKLDLIVWLSKNDVQLILDVFAYKIWPIFAASIRHLRIDDGDYLDNLRRRISPTILTDLDQLNSIFSADLLPDVIAGDGPNATAGQALSKWLHTPRKDGQPKRLRCFDSSYSSNLEWVNNFKEAFRRATTSVAYNIQIIFYKTTTPIEPFELVNKLTKEKLTLVEDEDGVGDEVISDWRLKRYPISEKAVADQWENDQNWDANLNKVTFHLWDGTNNCTGPLSPSAEEEKEEADESNEK